MTNDELTAKCAQLEQAIMKLASVVEDILGREAGRGAAMTVPNCGYRHGVWRYSDGTFDKSGWVASWRPEESYLWRGRRVEYMRDGWEKPAHEIPPEANMVGLWVRVIGEATP